MITLDLTDKQFKELSEILVRCIYEKQTECPEVFFQPDKDSPYRVKGHGFAFKFMLCPEIIGHLGIPKDILWPNIEFNNIKKEIEN